MVSRQVSIGTRLSEGAPREECRGNRSSLHTFRFREHFDEPSPELDQEAPAAQSTPSSLSAETVPPSSLEAPALSSIRMRRFVSLRKPFFPSARPPERSSSHLTLPSTSEPAAKTLSSAHGAAINASSRTSTQPRQALKHVPSLTNFQLPTPTSHEFEIPRGLLDPGSYARVLDNPDLTCEPTPPPSSEEGSLPPLDHVDSLTLRTQAANLAGLRPRVGTQSMKRLIKKRPNPPKWKAVNWNPSKKRERLGLAWFRRRKDDSTDPCKSTFHFSEVRSWAQRSFNLGQRKSMATEEGLKGTRGPDPLQEAKVGSSVIRTRFWDDIAPDEVVVEARGPYSQTKITVTELV